LRIDSAVRKMEHVRSFLFFSAVMTQLADLWKLLPLLGLVIVIAAIAIVIVRIRRSRAVNPPSEVSGPSPSEADAAFLDSSHIGLEPFLGAKNLPPFEADAAMNRNDPERAPR